jgi:hypothetical protein
MADQIGAFWHGIFRRIAGVWIWNFDPAFPTRISHTDVIGDDDDLHCVPLMLQGFSDVSDVSESPRNPSHGENRGSSPLGSASQKIFLHLQSFAK